MKKIEWTMETLDNRSAFMRNIASNTTIKHKNTITEEVLEKIKEELITKCNHCNCESCVFASLKDGKCLMKTIINNHIEELKGEQK